MLRDRERHDRPVDEEHAVDVVLGQRIDVGTHAVHDGLAYPLGETPLWVTVVSAPADQNRLVVYASREGIAGAHCSIGIVGSDVIVSNHGSAELFVNEQKIEHTSTLKIGDKLRVGDIHRELQLIALIQDHETQDT